MSKIISYQDLPQIYPFGFRLEKCPSHILEPITEYYNYKKKGWNEKDYIYSIGDHEDFFNWVHESLKPIFIKEVKYPIEFSYMHGVYSHKKHEKIKPHREPLQTHHISAQILINKDKDWEFRIQDHNNTLHIFETNNIGDIILYEGAKLLHGRENKFKGEYYDILYVHFKLKL